MVLKNSGGVGGEFRNLFSAVHERDLEKAIAEIRKFDDPFPFRDCVYPKTGDSLLHVAAKIGFLELFRYFTHFDFYESFLNLRNFEGKVPLHDAAQFRQREVVELILKSDFFIDVDALKRGDWTPLMLASTKSGNLSILKLLLDIGKADPTLINKDGWNCFHLAVREGDVEMIRYLLKNNEQLWKTVSKNGRTPLHTAALSGNTEVIELIMKFYDDKKPDACGSIPVMDAVRGGNLEAVKLLMSPEILGVRDRAGRDCLSLASHSGHVDIVKYLINDLTFDVNINGNEGLTPLHWAAMEGHSTTVKELISRGAKGDIRDSKNRTPLDYAVLCSKHETEQILSKLK